MNASAAIVAVVFLLTVVGIVGCVLMMQHEAALKAQDDATIADLEAKQRAATDALRVKGESDAALDADLARALKRPPPDTLAR